MSEKRFVYCFEGIEDTWETDEEYKYTPCTKDGFQDLCEMLNELHKENEMRKEHQRTLENEIRRLKDRVKTFEKNYSLKGH